MTDQTLDNTASALVASKVVTFGGSAAGALFSWVGSIDLGLLVSLIIAISSFFLNWHYARKKDKRDALKTKAYLESLEDNGGCDVEQD